MRKDVWFDNLNVENYQSEVLEEDHYYPFGLILIQPLIIYLQGSRISISVLNWKNNFK
ncbi:hypothetical protein [Taibaiella lutea]|uniref:hypothetical protein n=1 Tax=Taibaiella lutea TaxID=2608001 RepID=UPI00167FE0C1|nr:hypothetical protein [Taibaiella lutea]